MRNKFKKNDTTYIILVIFSIILIILSTIIFHKINVLGKEKEETVEKTAYVFIGDSRTVGMDKALNFSSKDDTFVVAENGVGYNWFIKTGSEKLCIIRENNKDYTNWVYIFNLGVNDLVNINNYINLYRDLSKEATVYYVSINPTDDSVGGIQCEDIEEFNKKIHIEDYENYINSYQYLTDVSGFDFDKRKDGMHYNEETYSKLYDFIMMSVDVHEFVKTNDDRYSAYYYLYNVK